MRLSFISKGSLGSIKSNAVRGVLGSRGPCCDLLYRYQGRGAVDAGPIEAGDRFRFRQPEIPRAGVCVWLSSSSSAMAFARLRARARGSTFVCSSSSSNMRFSCPPSSARCTQASMMRCCRSTPASGVQGPALVLLGRGRRHLDWLPLTI